MRSRGWAGRWPASDEEAIARILDAADEVVSERGSAMRIADVARTLGVTRQTVYRYFPGTEALLVASAMRAADGFIDQLSEHVGGMTDPVAADLGHCVELRPYHPAPLRHRLGTAGFRRGSLGRAGRDLSADDALHAGRPRSARTRGRGAAPIRRPLAGPCDRLPATGKGRECHRLTCSQYPCSRGVIWFEVIAPNAAASRANISAASGSASGPSSRKLLGARGPNRRARRRSGHA